MGKAVHSIACVSKELAIAECINSVKHKYPELRQKSKAVTFAAQYQGTYRTFMNASGFSEEDAKALEANYKRLYCVSEEYTQKHIKYACTNGHVDVAFGLRIRTPLLKQVIYGPSMPYQAAAEGRTIGNALSQSYGLLNNRAAVEFMQKVWASPYRYDIKPTALVHDAIYLLVSDDVHVVHWVNKELITSMQWQELPEIKHDVVKLGAALDIYWPNWSNPVTLPNNATKEEIFEICHKAKDKYEESKNHH